ncbi:uncharacterized protein [Cardiocondyla obscurior]|uniref:uncharacterized protein n=1 Tax=Cardiocondyla obscurior TaxID=286306 RepID=UPI0039658A6B
MRRKKRRYEQLIIEKWSESLESTRTGLRVVEAIRPILQEWLITNNGPMTYRLTQVLSGHGCFKSYLCSRARREINEQCSHCSTGDQDTAQHTLEFCSAWALQRYDLTRVIGNNLELPIVVNKMVSEKANWTAMINFCEEIINLKKIAERERESDLQAPLCRKHRGGRRRRQFNLLP